MKRTSLIQKRNRVARRLERAAVPERPVVCRGPQYIVRPSVTMACAPSLRAIAALLRDDTVSVDRDQLHALQSFVSDGGSAFFGDDPTAALSEAVRLQHLLIGVKPAATNERQLESEDIRRADPAATAA
jgi:hypothetical protein